jgi:hypothetical protein
LLRCLIANTPDPRAADQWLQPGQALLISIIRNLHMSQREIGVHALLPHSGERIKNLPEAIITNGVIVHIKTGLMTLIQQLHGRWRGGAGPGQQRR